MVFLLILLFLLAVLFLVLFVLTFKRLNRFEDLFYGLENVIFNAVNYFDKLLTTPLFMNTPEIVEAHHNMKVIRDQLIQFAMKNGGEVVQIEPQFTKEV